MDRMVSRKDLSKNADYAPNIYTYADSINRILNKGKMGGVQAGKDHKKLFKGC